MSGLFRGRWSTHIHQEWMNAVHEKYGIPLDQLTVRRDCMNASVPDGCVTGYEPLIEGLKLPDPDDRHVLAAAIRCGASAIVTFNEKDFPQETIGRFGIHTRHPDDFIVEIDGVDPGTLADAVSRDIAHYQNPPLTLDTYIEGLRTCRLPKTADYLNKVRVLLTND